MSWRKWFGAKDPAKNEARPSEHCVTVHLDLSEPPYGSHEDRNSVHRLSDRLAEAIAIHAAGEFDGDEFGDGKCVLYMYGPDADRLFAAIMPVLKDQRRFSSGRIVRRFGPPGSRTEENDLASLRQPS